jgi:hypothetical protein
LSRSDVITEAKRPSISDVQRMERTQETLCDEKAIRIFAQCGSSLLKNMYSKNRLAAGKEVLPREKVEAKLIPYGHVRDSPTVSSCCQR